jgi:hypothetical protein
MPERFVATRSPAALAEAPPRWVALVWREIAGKVACFVAADAGTEPSKAARKASEAAALFALARRFAERAVRAGGAP